jgi:hypothetical protein
MRVRFLLLSLIVFTVLPTVACAQAPAVSPSELRQALTTAAANRQKNLDEVRNFFAGAPARQALSSAKVDYQKVERAVAALSPDEAASLAVRTQQIQRDFAAGALTNQELTYIVIALAAAVLVLVIVAA